MSEQLTSGDAPVSSPSVLFMRLTALAELEPWYGDFRAAIDGACEVSLFDAASSVADQLARVSVVVDLGGFAGKEVIDAGADAGVKLWQVLGYGLDHIDQGHLRARGIPLAHTPGACTETALAEHAIHLMLSVEKRWKASQAVLEAGVYGGPFCGELDGQVLGIVGLGASGRALSLRAAALGMRVVAIDARAPSTAESAAARCDFLGDLGCLDELLTVADYVSLHLPLTAETYHVLDAAALSKMKTSAVVINVARGALIDQDALVAALRNESLGGAGLDVFEQEPLARDDPLFEFDNVIITPHMAGLTRQTSIRRARVAASNVLRVLAGDGPLEGAVE
jgi:phosphoglycerate dehydrogenase-like enzyme